MPSRYNDATILYTSNNKPYFKGKKYPSIPLSENDTYIISTIEDRLDILAFQYYGDVELWWVISIASNNVTNGSMFPVPGTQLRIPANISSVLELYKNFNE